MDFMLKGRYGAYTVKVDAANRKIEGVTVVSANCIEQILDEIQFGLQANFGNYRWKLEGNRGNYRIVAYYGAKYYNGSFVESRGATPMKAFFNCYAINSYFNNILKGK